MHQLRIRIDSIRQLIEPPTEDFERARALYLIVPPAARSTSLQALSRSGERAQVPIT